MAKPAGKPAAGKPKAKKPEGKLGNAGKPKGGIKKHLANGAAGKPGGKVQKQKGDGASKDLKGASTATAEPGKTNLTK